MKADTPEQFSHLTIALHWIVGLTVIGLLAVGVYMEETEAYSLYPWHKSFGFLIFFVVLLRVAWRIKNGWPTPVGQYSKVEQILAKVVHWVLILGTVLMPISGFLMSAFGGPGVEVFGLEVVARNANPDNPSEVIAHNKAIASFTHSLHHWLGEALIIAVALHVVGAIKHHVIDKDGSIRRMLGARV